MKMGEDMKYKKVVVVGGGILGSQIAFQSAYCGYDVTVLVVDVSSVDPVKEKFKNLHKTYVKAIKDMNKPNTEFWARGIASTDAFNYEECLDKAKKALSSIKIEYDQESALKDVDLVIESITEDFNVKANFYKEISNKLPEKTVIVTNSSTLLPSKLAGYTGRPEKYLSLHFANNIWKNNIAEVMKHDRTDEKYFKEIIKFAESINMIPLAAKEEKSGYILNSLLVPFLLSALDMMANGISDPKTIDKAWTLGTGAPKGPFRIMDTVGLITARNIVLQYQKVPNLLDPLLKKMMMPYNYDGMLRILDEYIAKGKLGESTKEGFYKYDD
jgi:3-hydroxybutyryl-CoA dehydrogenase